MLRKTSLRQPKTLVYGFEIKNRYINPILYKLSPSVSRKRLFQQSMLKSMFSILNTF